jgi:2-oxoisovalerate dehydrogenase E1 component beta subunit
MAEGGIVGAAVGMALYGLRPVPEIQFADFVWPGFEQIAAEMARLRFRSAGQYSCPVVLRLPYGAGIGGGMDQSASPEAYFCHTPGLTVVCPSDPEDAAGLLRTALRGQDPVIFLEPKRLYRTARAEVPDDAEVAIGTARIRRAGTDVTVLCYGAMVPVALAAAEAAAASGIQSDVIDLRTLVPVDIATILTSIARTGRAVIVAEAPRTCSYAAELAALLAERAILHLEAPVLRVTGLDAPLAHVFEDTYLPDPARVRAAIERVANF